MGYCIKKKKKQLRAVKYWFFFLLSATVKYWLNHIHTRKSITSEIIDEWLKTNAYKNRYESTLLSDLFLEHTNLTLPTRKKLVLIGATQWHPLELKGKGGPRKERKGKKDANHGWAIALGSRVWKERLQTGGSSDEDEKYTEEQERQYREIKSSILRRGRSHLIIFHSSRGAPHLSEFLVCGWVYMHTCSAGVF